MPKYKITEVDDTGAITLSEQPNIVYIPGAASAKTEPKLCRSISELQAIEGLAEDDSYFLAHKLLSLGMQVLYQGFVADSAGDITIEADDWAKLQDKNLYNVRFLTTGAYACPSTNMVACASTRGDCVALLDHAKTVTTVENVRSAFSNLESKYAAAFTPWFTCKFDASHTSDVPASFGYLLAYARSVQSNPLWKATAGVFRGRIPELVDVNVKYTTAECDVLQGRTTNPNNLDDNEEFAINPISYRRYSGFVGGFNYIVNGNRTTLAPEANSTLKATNFLNVRLLVTEISKTLYDASVTYTFEQNSDVLWINFKSLITPLLDKMQSGEGIAGYRLERVATNKRGRLCARLIIVPIEAIEDFELEIYLEDSLDASIEVRG